MSVVVTSIVALLGQLLPLLTSAANATLITSIIETLASIVPFVVQEVETLAPAIKNIIAALSANPATTAEQLATLQTLDAQVDAAFDDAAKDTDAGT